MKHPFIWFYPSFAVLLQCHYQQELAALLPLQSGTNEDMSVLAPEGLAALLPLQSETNEDMSVLAPERSNGTLAVAERRYRHYKYAETGKQHHISRHRILNRCGVGLYVYINQTADTEWSQSGADIHVEVLYGIRAYVGGVSQAAFR